MLYTPQYLVSKLKRTINNLVLQTATMVFKFIANNSMMPRNSNVELRNIAEKYNCQFDGFDVETKNEIIKLPQTSETATIKLTSSFIVNESYKFVNELKVLQRLTIGTGRIELHRLEDSTAPSVS